MTAATMFERFDPAGGSFNGPHTAFAATGVSRVMKPTKNKRHIWVPRIAAAAVRDALYCPAITAVGIFPRWREAACASAALVVVAHSRVTGNFVSARDHDEYQRLKATVASVLAVEELDGKTFKTLAASRMR